MHLKSIFNPLRMIGHTTMPLRCSTTSNRKLHLEPLEDRLVLSATLQDAGISQRVIDYIDNLPWTTEILTDTTLTNTLDALVGTQVAPGNATVLTSVGDLSQITAGTVANPNVYLIQGDLSITNTIAVPSNVHIYVDGSIFKPGNFTAPGGVHSVENTGTNADAIFRLNGSDNVKLIGVNDALLHSTPNLSVNSPHSTGIFIGGQSTNVEVDGFEIAFVWNGVAAHPFNIHDVTITNNYIHDTLDRAIWSLGTTNLRAAHNFIENPGIDGLDWDAFTNDAIGYENVSIGAGRWAGFVEEGTEDSYFIRGLGILADFGNPNRGFMLGWADNGSSQFFVNNNPNPDQWTEHNYFIDNVIFNPGNIPNSGGDYFAKNNHGKGPTYFWANRGFGAGQSTTFFDNAEWLTFLPTSGGRNNAVNAVQLLADLNEEFNDASTLLLSAPNLTIAEFAPIGTAVGTVTPLNADVNDVTFSITGGNTGNVFAINNDGLITLQGVLDFETQSNYTLTVEALDTVSTFTGSTSVNISVVSPFETVTTLFDHDFTSPDFFNAASVVGQQGWTAQTGWGVTDAGGDGFLNSSTTAFQGVTNNERIDLNENESIRLILDFDLDFASAANSDQFRYGFTTLDSGGTGTFVPSLGNNSGNLLSGKLSYDTSGSDSIEFWLDETQTGSDSNAIIVSAAQLGLNVPGGDSQSDDIRVTWEANKTTTSGQWEIELSVENLTSSTMLGSKTLSATESTAYSTTNGLYAGIRGLANSTNTTFNVDRYTLQTVVPGAAITGDYNFDGQVNAADFSVWLSSLGQTGVNLPADGDRNGTVQQADYEVWKNNFGNNSAVVSIAKNSPVSATGSTKEETAESNSVTQEEQHSLPTLSLVRANEAELFTEPAQDSHAFVNNNELLIATLQASVAGNSNDAIPAESSATASTESDSVDSLDAAFASVDEYELRLFRKVF